ncbi:GD24702 [Drosophila simulans]|uniref:GD24702 n=1 Tax=Drosophila simulans TaxID=7240 RepID=B4NTS5_DROSI|nr:GD24702 [Drosophila simulans]
MAAQSRRYKNRRPKCSKTMSLAALILGLVGLTMVTLAAGNDAISAPKAGKDLQQQQQQRHQQTSEIEDDGGARPDKDFDFAAYVNGECLYGYFSRGGFFFFFFIGCTALTTLKFNNRQTTQSLSLPLSQLENGN